MSNSMKMQSLVPSLLSRLVDKEPSLTQETRADRFQVLSQLKTSLREDIENLLNTRIRNVVWMEHLSELDGSLLDYGLPDFIGLNLTSEAERKKFCRTIGEIIRKHEPRLSNVKVLPVSENEPLDRTFHFRIDATLRIDPAPEHVVFDSTMQPTTGDFEIGRNGG